MTSAIVAHCGTIGFDFCRTFDIALALGKEFDQGRSIWSHIVRVDGLADLLASWPFLLEMHDLPARQGCRQGSGSESF